MASDFETQFEAAFNSPAAVHFAETIPYTVAGGSEADVTMIPLREEAIPIEDESSTGTHNEMPSYLLAADVTSPTSPLEATGSGVDSCTIDETTWYVRELMESDVAGWHKLLLQDKLLH